MRSSDEKLTASGTTLQINEIPKTDVPLAKAPIRAAAAAAVPHPIVPLKTMGSSYLK